jgi:hypothetical protein
VGKAMGPVCKGTKFVENQGKYGVLCCIYGVFRGGVAAQALSISLEPRNTNLRRLFKMSGSTCIKAGDWVELHMLIMIRDLKVGSQIADMDTIFENDPVVFMWGVTWECCINLENCLEYVKEWTKREFPLLASLRKISLTY